MPRITNEPAETLPHACPHIQMFYAVLLRWGSLRKKKNNAPEIPDQGGRKGGVKSGGTRTFLIFGTT